MSKVQLVIERQSRAMTDEITYPEHESKTLEFKSEIPKWQNLIKTCVAFANTSGGKIIIGVEDKTRKIIGITEATQDRMYEEFRNSLYDSTSPNIYAQLYEKNIADNIVFIIEIAPGLKKPYFIKSEGIRNGVYIRVGSSTRRANQDTIEELKRESTRITYDEEIISRENVILSKKLLEELYKKHFKTRQLEADKVVVPSAINPEKVQPTVAGVLFFTEEPQNYVPEAVVICTLFRGIEGRHIIQTLELTGPIPYLAEQAVGLTSGWLEREFELKGIKLQGNLPIPQDALREAILNALIHRKYSIPGAVKISIYDDRCEIFSPGGFPGLVDINNLGDGTTYLRNPIIARLARKTKLVEKLGSGIRMIFNSCRKMGIRKPEYFENGDFVKIVFYFAPSKNMTAEDDTVLLQYITQNRMITVPDAMQILEVSRNTATRRLNQLVKLKKIVRIGKGPAVRFELAE